MPGRGLIAGQAGVGALPRTTLDGSRHNEFGASAGVLLPMHSLEDVGGFWSTWQRRFPRRFIPCPRYLLIELSGWSLSTDLHQVRWLPHMIFDGFALLQSERLPTPCVCVDSQRSLLLPMTALRAQLYRSRRLHSHTTLAYHAKGQKACYVA